MQARTTDAAPSGERAATPAPVHRAGEGVGRVSTPQVGVLVVTWNRKDVLERCLRAIRGQTYPAHRLHVVVVDNASSDGTAQHVFEVWKPERAVDNAATTAEEPAITLAKGSGTRNAGGFRSLMLVRNAHNLGGCGGFNTGFLMMERTIAAHRQESMIPEDPRQQAAEQLGYVWLVDDDAEPAQDCLERLVSAAEADPNIGIVGSRMVDPTDRATTLESTVFFNPSTGLFGPPEDGHPRAAEHRAWLREVVASKGRHDAPGARRAMTGVRDVECVAACSMLARWSHARKLGYWDARFFIAGDDADWCLRFVRAGLRVVCCLDAVVYHLPWSRKQTVTQDYYRRRNLFWTWERVLPEADMKRLARARMRLILRQAWEACWRARAMDREIILRSALDAARGRGGKLEPTSLRRSALLTSLPEAAPLAEALKAVGADRPGATLAVVCPSPRILRQALRLRARVRKLGLKPSWVLVASADAVSPGLLERLTGGPRARPGDTPADLRLVRYGSRLASRVKRQSAFWLKPPSAWVIIDGRTDLPLVRAPRTLQVDTRTPDKARGERLYPGGRAWFALRWVAARVRCVIYLATLKPRVFEGKFGVAPKEAKGNG